MRRLKTYEIDKTMCARIELIDLTRAHPHSFKQVQSFPSQVFLLIDRNAFMYGNKGTVVN